MEQPQNKFIYLKCKSRDLTMEKITDKIEHAEWMLTWAYSPEWIEHWENIINKLKGGAQTKWKLKTTIHQH